MQVGYGHNRALELRVARREGHEQVAGSVDERRLKYRRVVKIGRHDRGIHREHVRTGKVIGVIHEDASVLRGLEGRSRR